MGQWKFRIRLLKLRIRVVLPRKERANSLDSIPDFRILESHIRFPDFGTQCKAVFWPKSAIWSRWESWNIDWPLPVYVKQHFVTFRVRTHGMPYPNFEGPISVPRKTPKIRLILNLHCPLQTKLLCPSPRALYILYTSVGSGGGFASHGVFAGTSLANATLFSNVAHKISGLSHRFAFSRPGIQD